MDRIQAQTGDVIDLADILRSIKNGWAVVAGMTAAGLVLAVLVLVVVPPVFSGKASIFLKTGGSGNGSMSSLASAISAISDAGGGGGGILPGIKSSVETETDIMQSRSLTGEVVDSLMLQALVSKPRATPAIRAFGNLSLPGSFRPRDYSFTPIGTPAGQAPRFRFVAKGDSGIAVVGQAAALEGGIITLAPTAPKEGFAVTFRDHEDATTRVQDHLSFDKPKTDVAHFEYRGDDSLSAATVPNLLLRLYLERRRGVDRGTNQKKAEFLERQVDSAAGALTVAERALRAQREASGVVNPVLAGQADFETETRLRTQLTDFQMQERALQQLVDQVHSGTASPRQLSSYPQYMGNGSINSIVANLISVETERDALLQTLTEQDDRVKALTARAKALEAQLMPLAQTTLAALASERGSIEQRIQSIQQSLVGVPRAAESYDRLEREVLDLAKIFSGLQVQLVDARLAAISEGGDVRPLDLAVPPKRPIFPRKSVILGEGFGGGLFVGLIVAVLLGLVGGKMHDAQDVERRTGLPAIRFETTAPLLVGGPASRTVLVAPIDRRAIAGPVAQRLVETALSRSISATLLDLSALELPANIQGNGKAHLITKPDVATGFDPNAAIRRLEESHDLVVVQLSALTSHTAAAVLTDDRPVLLVAPVRRIERNSLQHAVDLLRRVGAPCAGVVLHGDDRRRLGA
jgi:uncharacterized protein involved in exopolysaccharide biosynthesis